MPETEQTVFVFTGRSESPKGRAKLLDGEESTVGAVKLPLEKVKANLFALANSLVEALPPVEHGNGKFTLKTFEVELGIDGKGHVGFLGTGTEVGGHATFKLVFER